MFSFKNEDNFEHNFSNFLTSTFEYFVTGNVWENLKVS